MDMAATDESIVEVGSAVPAFRLPASTGKDVDVGDYKDRSNLVLFFVREFN
jgi:peroxiredoxin